MSNNESEVKVTKDNGYKTQWAKGIFYRQEGNKLVFKSEYTKYGIATLFILTTLVLLFQEDPTVVPKKSNTIKPPSEINASVTIELESYSEIKKKAKTTNKKKKMKIEKLSIVSRDEKLKIPLGAQARAKLITGGTNGPVKAKLIEDLSFNGEVYLPEGSIIWGKGASTDERLIVIFSKAVLSDGVSKDILANAYDQDDEILGLKGSIIGRTSKKLLAGAGLGVAGALQTMQSNQNIGGVAVKKPSLENALMNGASTAALGMAEQELEELKNKQTIIEVKKGTEIIVVFSKG
ncbi:MAG: TrbI/VirB10 family protein [Pseudobdellovibrionaceae bacterium]|nr:MAG: TrbI/VirB10 family protein [Pseudobdellovibrionaceae bacterium]